MIHVEHHGPVTAIRMARTFLGRPIQWSAAYWVDGLLIDTGPRCTEDELVRILEPVPVNSVVITHAHEDHVGGLARVCRQFPDAKIYASRQGLPFISDPTKVHLQLYRRLMWGVPRAVEHIEPLDAVDNIVETASYHFRVVETPGHSRDHVSLFEPDQRWLFCGDAFMGGEDRAWLREVDLFAVISSLRTLESLRPERLFPGSGMVRRTPRPDIHAKIGHLIELCQEVASLDAAGLTVPEIVEYLFYGESSFRLWTGGHYSAANLVAACRSYNDLMHPNHVVPKANQVSEQEPKVTRDRPDSPANESTDRGDISR